MPALAQNRSMRPWSRMVEATSSSTWARSATSTVTARAADLVGDGSGAVPVQVGHHDRLGALGGEAPAQGRADAVPAARDDDDLPAQLHGAESVRPGLHYVRIHGASEGRGRGRVPGVPAARRRGTGLAGVGGAVHRRRRVHRAQPGDVPGTARHPRLDRRSHDPVPEHDLLGGLARDRGRSGRLLHLEPPARPRRWRRLPLVPEHQPHRLRGRREVVPRGGLLQPGRRHPGRRRLVPGRWVQGDTGERRPRRPRGLGPAAPAPGARP